MEVADKSIIFAYDIAGLNTAEEQFEPYGWYKEMRENAPVYYDEKQQVWNVFLYKDVERVLSDYQLFSSKNNRRLSFIPGIADPERDFNSMDPPRHSKRRGLIANAFTPKSLKAWEPRVAAVADYLLEHIGDRVAVDIFHELAVPMPMTVIAQLLGVPSSDWMQFKQWSDTLALSGSRDTFADVQANRTKALQEMAAYLYPIVQQKREQPQDDLISDLVNAEYEGARLTDQDIIESSIGFLFAGNETTTNLLANAFYCLLVEYPSAYETLRNDLSLVPNMVEEVLRYRPSIQVMPRYITQDTTVFGPKMKAGETILVWVGSANRDEAQFVNGDNFDIRRPNSSKHLTFGKGVHFCLGAPLSRMEADFAITGLFKRYSRISVQQPWTISNKLQMGIGMQLSGFPVYLEQ